jgi:CheY-like chemotaxis protein
MLVEDNPITRKMVRFALEKQGFAVLDAPDAATALRLFVEHDVALVLQDLVLPDMDGFDLVQQLRALPRGSEVPMLAVSGLMSKLEEARVSAVGFDDVISKPVEPSRLVQIVRAHLPAIDVVGQPFGEGRRMVVADDDHVQGKLVGFRLRKLGFKVTDAANGFDALELARRLRPDVIVSDVLMPQLDGFELCMRVRRDERLRGTPLILVTNSYVEAADRELARRVGANDMVLRTPDLRALIESLRHSLGQGAPTGVAHVAPDTGVERERMRRVMKQLERQVTLNARVARRCAFLTAELSVLSGISEALAKQDDIESALRQVLAACLDAGGVAVGALCYHDAGRFRVISFGAWNGWGEAELNAFFARTGVLDGPADKQSVIHASSDEIADRYGGELLAAVGLTTALITPLDYRGKRLGALLTGSRNDEMRSDDRVFFAQAVAGQVSQALALAQAFAAKDESERAAHGQANVLRSILESIAEGVIVADESGSLIHWNSAATEILGPRSDGDPSQAPVAEHRLLRPDKRTPVPPDEMPLARATRGESLDDLELYVSHGDARDGAWLSVNARPLRGQAGDSHGGVMVFRDVTRDKAARTHLMVSDRMASVGMLAAGVAHEINNPLTAVIANLDVAARDVAAVARGAGDLGSLAAALADARDAADRVRKIVRDLKIFSRAEDEQHDPVDVRSVLDSSIRMAWNEIRHRARLIKDYQEVPFVDANESRLGQVFLNLIINAAQAIPEGQADRNEIRVSVSPVGEHRVAVDIADTGSGMPAEVVARLFTPFFTTKPAGVGTGLGLTICQRLIRDLGGEILVDSAVGRGTRFRVLLPKITGEARRPVYTAVAVPAAARRGRVLVIDDERAIGTVITRLFEDEHEVVCTTSAVEALELMGMVEPFDVILCDLMMPVMTGMDFYRELGGRAPEQCRAVVFLTGGAFTPKARTFLDEVPNQRLEKPFTFQNLRALINDRLAGAPRAK